MKTIAANLKANHTPQSTLAYLSLLQTELQSLQNAKKHNIIVFPNQASLTDNIYTHFEIGAQNAYPIQKQNSNLCKMPKNTILSCFQIKQV